MLIQIQDFSSYNQQQGREAGDELLRSVGQLLEEWQSEFTGTITGRRTGADFSLCPPDAEPA